MHLNVLSINTVLNPLAETSTRTVEFKADIMFGYVVLETRTVTTTRVRAAWLKPRSH